MTVTRVPVVDEYSEDGETVVLLDDGRVIALTAVPSAVLSLVDGGATEHERLTAELVALFGEPPGGSSPEAAVHAVLDHLSELGLLVVTTPAGDL
jgi:hypothetical protein